MSPRGWALANVWYDTLGRPPERDSPLETLLSLVRIARTNAELRGVRALVQANLPEGKAADPVIKAYQDYHSEMLPFLERAENADREKAREHLERFVKHAVQFDKRPIMQARLAKSNRAQRVRQNALRQRKDADAPTTLRQGIPRQPGTPSARQGRSAQALHDSRGHSPGTPRTE